MGDPYHYNPFYSSSTPPPYSTNTPHTDSFPLYPWHLHQFYTTNTHIPLPSKNLDFHHGYTPPSPNGYPSSLSYYPPYPSYQQAQPQTAYTYQHLPTPTTSPSSYSTTTTPIVAPSPNQFCHGYYTPPIQNPYASSATCITLYVSHTFQQQAQHSNPHTHPPHSHCERANQNTKIFQQGIQKISQALQKCKDDLRAIDEKFQTSQISIKTKRKESLADLSQKFRTKLQKGIEDELEEKESEEQVDEGDESEINIVAAFDASPPKEMKGSSLVTWQQSCDLPIKLNPAEIPLPEPPDTPQLAPPPPTPPDHQRPATAEDCLLQAIPIDKYSSENNKHLDLSQITTVQESFHKFPSCVMSLLVSISQASFFWFTHHTECNHFTRW